MRRILLECRRSLGRVLQAAATRLLTHPALIGELAGDALTEAGIEVGVHREPDAVFRKLIRCRLGLCDETHAPREHRPYCRLGWYQYAKRPQA